MRDKYKIFLVLCLMLIMVITGCSKENKNEPEVTPTPEVTTTPIPEPTPTPVEDKYVDLTREEIVEVYNMYWEYFVDYNGDGAVFNESTCFIIAYYKYIGLDEFVLPVVVNYDLEKTKELFGGEWENLTPSPKFLKEGEFWTKGELTVSEIEQAILYGEESKVYILNDSSVNYKYKEQDAWVLPEKFSDYMMWNRYYGNLMLVGHSETDGGYFYDVRNSL